MHRLIAAIAICILPVLLGSPASAASLPLFGGPGGGAASYQCQTSAPSLVGFTARVGLWMDQIQPICAGFSPSGTVHRTVNGPAFGGSGGGATSGMCADGSVVTGIRVGAKLNPDGGPRPQYVDFIELECTKLTDLNRVVASNPNRVCIGGSLGCYNSKTYEGEGSSFGGDFEPPSQRCPFNEGATGIGVRYGSFVDAVGLICGSQPAVSTPAPAPPPVVVADKPAPPPADPSTVIPAPSPAPGVNFTGEWTSESAGNSYTMTISQTAAGTVFGEYVRIGSPGTRNQLVKGVVVGRQLIAQWIESGQTGIAKFELSADGNSFSGGWASGANMPLPGQNAWNGARVGAMAQGGQPPEPAPAGGTPTTSICGLPGGTATVVIANPEITSLNVRDKPAGTILSTLPVGAQVEVVGGCGMKVAAGLVADAGGGAPPVPGWCAIASPMVGCVSEQFLVAGAAAPPVAAAGLVANPPQNAPAPAPPPVAAVDQPTTSTCGLPGGAATVVIPDPAISILNVRDKPAGTILTTIPRGAQVNVVGGCGVKVAAGLVADAGGGQPPVPGWCAISSPAVGCVSEQFLMSGAAAPPVVAAGLVANPPQTAPAPQPPPVAEAPPAQGAGGQAARLIQGANIRSGPGSKKTSVLQSLPGGSVVTVIGCASGWCQLAMPQYPVAWVFQDFLAFDVAPAAPVDVAIAPGDQQGIDQVAPPPAPAGEQNVTSTCGLPGGPATVVIADPSITILNVRDKPAGTILNTIARGSQVNVVGGCGVKVAAGLVADAGGGQPPVPGWCAISSPMVGCVSEQFLAAGVAPPPVVAAGLVANPPQTAPAPEPPPPVADVAPAPAAGGQAARLTKGANIRSGPGSKNTSVLQSLPGGSVVTVLGCASGWCQLAMPQYPAAWVFQDFLAFDGGGVQAPAPGIQVTINLGGQQGGGDQGGDQQGGADVAPPPPAEGGGQPTTSTCGVPGGTATVVIPDPSVPVLNVRDKPSGNIVTTIPRDSQVNVVGGCGVKIAAGLVADGGGGQPPVPGWCAISQPVVGCVSERFLVAGIPAGGQPAPAPAAGLVADQPQQAAAPSFTGTWNAEAQGASFTFNLTQDGKSVYGNYSGSDGSSGQIKGKLKGNVLRFAWRQTDNLSGAGKFVLSADGNAFSGSYTMGTNPDVADGAWNGTRQ